MLAKAISVTRYYVVHLRANGKGKTCKVHRFVAEFLPNPNNHPVVNLKDGNKLNNHVNNLEWCKYGENNKHIIDTRLRKIEVGYIKCQKVSQFNLDDNFIAEYNSIKDAEKATSVSICSICNCASGYTKTVEGYVWIRE